MSFGNMNHLRIGVVGASNRTRVCACVCKVLADQHVIKTYWGVEWVSARLRSRRLAFSIMLRPPCPLSLET